MLNRAALLRQLSEDRALAIAMVFPHRHRQASPSFHIDIIDLWRSQDERVVIEAFRGGAKTTLSEEFLMLAALFQNFHYMLLFGETYTKACERITAMKHEFQTNERLKALFGNLKPTGRDAKWAENKIVLTNGVAIEAHGWEEEIRGYKHLDKRPDIALLDDIENKERVRDTATVDANWRKLHMELWPALDKEFGRVRMTGTPLADDCMITRAAKSPHWTHGRFPICSFEPEDPRAEAIWPDRYPLEWIRQQKKHFEEEGMLSEFNQEYMLIAAGSKGKPFKEEMLVYADFPPHRYSPFKVIIDPARTTDIKKSDHSGFVVVSRIGTRIYVHKSGGRYWQPDEVIDAAFDLSREHEEAEVAIEKDSLDGWLLQPIRARMLLTGRNLKLKPLKAPQDRNKAQFILGLRPFFQAGDIILVGGRDNHQQLISQLLNFPEGMRDILNALAYVPRIYAGIPIYGDFSDANIVTESMPSRRAALALGVYATAAECCAVLCAVDPPHVTVLADWASPLVPADAIPDIVQLLRAVYPGRPITAWVPADVFDQVGRNPLLTALKNAKIPAQQGEHVAMARGTLSGMIRTEARGKRLLTVDNNARDTLQALSSGYCWPVTPGGDRGAEPEPGAPRTLLEALECLTYALNKPDTAAQLKTNAVNTLGTPYMSALPRRG